MVEAVVVGAGPAGSVAALELARSGVRVLLLERSRLPREKVCAEFLSPGVIQELRRLQVPSLDSLMSRPLSGFRVSLQSGAGFEGRYAPGFGAAVPRGELDMWLARAAANAGAEVAEGSRVTGIERRSGEWSLRVRTPAGETKLETRAMVAADGLHSTMATRLGLRTRLRGPRRIAVVSHMALPGRGECGEMHVRRDAYCGVAPLSIKGAGQLANVALVVDQSEAANLRRDPHRYFLQSLAVFRGLRERLTEAPIVRPILTTGPMCAGSRSAPEGLFLAGDAAGFRDPFTGQGIYRALRGGAMAAMGVREALTGRGDATRRFESRREGEFRGQRAVEWLVQAFLARPALFERIVDRLAQRPEMADTLLGVTGDVLPARRVLTPGFLAQLVMRV